MPPTIYSVPLLLAESVCLHYLHFIEHFCVVVYIRLKCDPVVCWLCSHSGAGGSGERPWARAPTTCWPRGGVHQRQKEVYEERGRVYEKVRREAARRVGHAHTHSCFSVEPGFSGAREIFCAFFLWACTMNVAVLESWSILRTFCRGLILVADIGHSVCFILGDMLNFDDQISSLSQLIFLVFTAIEFCSNRYCTKYILKFV